MASSNRHWPSMFKSKPCNNQQWSTPHDTNHHQSSLLSNSCGRSSSTFSSGGEERSPEPKPRWNPKPEQIRILESIFNSGMVNPPRDEIRRIRAQLQEYGQVGDANVFYWFQNRKSRSKHKQRTLQAKMNAATGAHNSPPPMPASSSSSSSDKASPGKVPPCRSTGGGSSSYGGNSSSNNSSNTNNNNNNNNNNVGVDQFGNSPTSVNQCNPYFHQLVTLHHTTTTAPTTTASHEFVTHEPLFFPLGNFSQGLCFGPTHHDTDQHQLVNNNVASVDVSSNSNPTVGGFSSLLLGDMFGGGGGSDHTKRVEAEKFKFQQELSFLATNPPNATTTCAISSSPVPTATPTVIPTSLGQMLGVGDAGGLAGKSMVFINGVAIEIPVAPLNLKEEFGEDAVLIHSASGHPVPMNEWGVTLHPLQHGASYYLVGNVAAPPLIDKLDTTHDILAQGFPYQI